MATSTMYVCFGDLSLGEKFVFFNPFFHAKPDFSQEVMTKISPRRYLDSKGVIFHSTSKTGIARIV